MRAITHLYVHKNYLIIHTPDPNTNSPYWFRSMEPMSPNVVVDTYQHLLISSQALDILQEYQETPGYERGHIDWYEAKGLPGYGYFEWLGGPNRIYKLDKIKFGYGFNPKNYCLGPDAPPHPAVGLIESTLRGGL